MYIYICVCVCVCVCVYIYIYIYIYKSVLSIYLSQFIHIFSFLTLPHYIYIYIDAASPFQFSTSF